MTTITIDRATVEQALDVLNLVSDEGESKFPATIQGVISDLEAALAQQAEPQPMHPELQKMWEDHIDKCFRAIPVPEQAEPVQMHPSQFAEMIKGKEALTGIPVYWAEWPSKEDNDE